MHRGVFILIGQKISVHHLENNEFKVPSKHENIHWVYFVFIVHSFVARMLSFGGPGAGGVLGRKWGEIGKDLMPKIWFANLTVRTFKLL